MTQVSPNTIAYDQIFFRIREFIQNDIDNKYLTNEERVEEYKNMLLDIQDSLFSPSTKYDPYINGEPPRSDKLNKFASTLANDLNVLAKQVDYLNAKTVNSFNLFNKELETEKKYSERIASKVKILQMYNKSSSNDLVYVGDSFDNYDQIDVEQIPVGYNPNVSEGFFTLPVEKIRTWNVSRVSVLPTDGFYGNNHQVIKSDGVNGESYQYVFQQNPGISLVSNVIDSNPLTYFEVDAINVDKNSVNNEKSLVSENEFCYVVDKKVVNNNTVGELVNWSNYNTSNPLSVTVSMDGVNTDSFSNFIEISPYFASTQLIKVTSINITDATGAVENILSQPIYIGSSIAPLNASVSKNYYYNKANIKYSERRTKKVEVTFEQDSAADVEVQHLYWKPNYPEGTRSNSPFVGLSRFNPQTLNRDIYEEIVYDEKALIPATNNPNQYKKNDLPVIQNYRVQLKRKPVTYEKWVISFSANNSIVYFYDFTEGFNESEADFIVNTPLPNSPVYDDGVLKVGSSITSSDNIALEIDSVVVSLGDKVTLNNQPDPRMNGYYTVTSVGSGSEKWKLTRALYIQWTEDIIFESQLLTPKYFESEQSGQQYVSAVQAYIDGLENSQVTVGSTVTTLANVEIKFYTKQSQSKTELYEVPLLGQYEVYKAKRLAVGIRDITVGHEIYADQTEIVSTPFLFDLPVESLMLAADANLDNTFTDKVNFNYYISVKDGQWISISPVQLDARGIAEVISFNQNISSSVQLPGVAYLNYPDVPQSINSVRVKIQINKDRNTNFTPVIYGYQLIAKVRR